MAFSQVLDFEHLRGRRRMALTGLACFSLVLLVFSAATLRFSSPGSVAPRPHLHGKRGVDVSPAQPSDNTQDTNDTNRLGIPGLPVIPGVLSAVFGSNPAPTTLATVPLPTTVPQVIPPDVVPVPTDAASPASPGSSPASVGLLGGLLGSLTQVVNNVIGPDGILGKAKDAVADIIDLPSDLPLISDGNLVNNLINEAAEALQSAAPVAVVDAVLGQVTAIAADAADQLNSVVGGVADAVGDGLLAPLPLPDIHGVLDEATKVLGAVITAVESAVTGVTDVVGDVLPVDLPPLDLTNILDSANDLIGGVVNQAENLFCPVESILDNGLVTTLLGPCGGNQNAPAASSTLPPVATLPVSLTLGSVVQPSTTSVIVTTLDVTVKPSVALPAFSSASLASLSSSLASLSAALSSFVSAPKSLTPVLVLPSSTQIIPTDVPASSSGQGPAASEPSVLPQQASPSMPSVPIVNSAPGAGGGTVSASNTILPIPLPSSALSELSKQPANLPILPTMASDASPALPYGGTVTQVQTTTVISVVTSCDQQSLPTNPLAGPCPGKGYSCDSCPDGWFCPPQQTPARSAPCGYGWPCPDCPGGWFCVPAPSAAAQPNAMCPGHGMPPLEGASGFMSLNHPMITATVTVTASPPPPPPAPPRPSINVNGWNYAGCYLDREARALKGDNQLTTGPEGMSNAMCIDFCNARGFSVSGTEYGSQCFCGNALVDSWLIDDSKCNMTCSGDSNDICGGPWALAIYGPTGQPAMSQGPILAFTLTEPPPGVAETSLHTGGMRQTVMQVTTPIFVFPAPAPVSSTPGSCMTSPPQLPPGDASAVVSSLSSVITSVQQEASSIVSSELDKASSIVQTVESIVNSDLSIIASHISSIQTAAPSALGGQPPVPNPFTIPNGQGGPGPVIPSGLGSAPAPSNAQPTPGNLPSPPSGAGGPPGSPPNGGGVPPPTPNPSPSPANLPPPGLPNPSNLPGQPNAGNPPGSPSTGTPPASPSSPEGGSVPNLPQPPAGPPSTVPNGGANPPGVPGNPGNPGNPASPGNPGNPASPGNPGSPGGGETPPGSPNGSGNPPPSPPAVGPPGSPTTPPNAGGNPPAPPASPPATGPGGPGGGNPPPVPSQPGIASGSAAPVAPPPPPGPNSPTNPGGNVPPPGEPAPPSAPGQGPPNGAIPPAQSPPASPKTIGPPVAPNGGSLGPSQPAAPPAPANTGPAAPPSSPPAPATPPSGPSPAGPPAAPPPSQQTFPPDYGKPPSHRRWFDWAHSGFHRRRMATAGQRR
ncbi:uncharacterized protein E0L32_004541 [Thyridium curvatum]|uniref:WSC domain-containing protein n=1 Tax=Thyridium curvatum TaxID=1093900 RepID=A0A507B9H7_9PEZI|nr:uncharacterized protein E0L32_004541 [Thyridium curvatum]TPX15264.1 hypothetical protein E0L32_004541 [Thyridium curvatum]